MLVDSSVLVSHKIHTESLALLLLSAHTYKSCVPRVVQYYSVSSRTSDVCTFCPFLFSSCSHQHDNSLIMCHCKFDCGMPLSQSTDGGTRSVSHLTDQLTHSLTHPSCLTLDRLWHMASLTLNGLWHATS